MPRILLAAVACFLVLTACSSESGPKAKADPAPVVWTLAYDADPPVLLVPSVGSPVLDGSTLVYSYTGRATKRANRIASTDLATVKRTDLTTGSFARGSITSIAIVGNRIVYGEESGRGTLTPGAARWRIVALRPDGKEQVLATSGRRRETMSPDLTTVDGAAVWTVYPDEGGDVRVFSWKPGQEAAKPEDVRLGDAHECRPNTSNPDLVAGCVLRNGWIAWTERADAAEDEAVSDDPVHLFVSGASSGSPQLIADLESSTTPPEILGDYLLWDRGDGIEITSLEHLTATAEVATGDSGIVVSDDGRSAVVLTRTARSTTAQVVDIDNLHLTTS